MPKYPQQPIFLLLLIFILFFLCLWCPIVWLFGRLNGWQQLARSYPFFGELPQAKLFRHQSVLNMALRNCVNIACDDRGIYFQMWILFRLGAGSIFIPWSEISLNEDKYFWMKSLRLSLRKSDQILHLDARTTSLRQELYQHLKF